MKLKTVSTLALLALATTACASVNTEYDETAIVYYGAMGGATKFEKCIAPAKRESVSVSDNSWTYPYGQRSYDFSGAEAGESKPLKVVSRDNVEMTVSGLVTFTLNTECKTLQEFHERIGSKFSAFFYGTQSEESLVGWGKMLNTYMRVPLDRALDAASQEFEWRGLFNDPKVKQAWEKRAGELAAQFIKETAQGQFFCSPAYVPAAAPAAGSAAPATPASGCGNIVLTIQKPEPPAALVNALAAEQIAKTENAAQTQRNAKVRTEIESIKDLARVLGPQGAVLWQAIQKGQVTVVPVPQGTDLNVTAGKP
ncbi:SPFH domain-containing protein [Streptosporangium sp. OZ121]|uniref:SPFH domain-containing protein n=1 Tax=Streptosporangium sp. OZ121 TaxID=3444183 RepID=UPI003F79E69D